MTLQGMNLKNINLEKNDTSSQNGLVKEYKKLSIQLKQLQILEKKHSTQLEQLKTEERTLAEEMQKFAQLDVSARENQDKLLIRVCPQFVSNSLQMLRSDKGAEMTLLTEQLVQLMRSCHYILSWIDAYCHFQSDLRHKQTVTEDVVREAERRTREIKDTLRNNEAYKKIAHLEDKLDDIKQQYKGISEQLELVKQDLDYEVPKTAAEKTLNEIMELLREQ